MLMDGPKKRFMANPTLIFQMTRLGDQYTIQYDDGIYIENITGTLEEIAYLIFSKCMTAPRLRPYYRAWSPFQIKEENIDGKTYFTIQLEIPYKIEPEPEPAFWKDLNRHFQRFVNLMAFS